MLTLHSQIRVRNDDFGAIPYIHSTCTPASHQPHQPASGDLFPDRYIPHYSATPYPVFFRALYVSLSHCSPSIHIPCCLAPCNPCCNRFAILFIRFPPTRILRKVVEYARAFVLEKSNRSHRDSELRSSPFNLVPYRDMLRDKRTYSTIQRVNTCVMCEEKSEHWVTIGKSIKFPTRRRRVSIVEIYPSISGALRVA